MALTPADRADVLRFCGVSVIDPMSIDLVDRVLLVLTPEQETVLRTVYLAQLRYFETSYAGMLTDLDTKKAGPWERNTNFFGEYLAAFALLKRNLCYFLGVPCMGDAALEVPVVFVV